MVPKRGGKVTLRSAGERRAGKRVQGGRKTCSTKHRLGHLGVEARTVKRKQSLMEGIRLSTKKVEGREFLSDQQSVNKSGFDTRQMKQTAEKGECHLH